MTIHEIKDERRGDTNFSIITREFYKKVISVHDRKGGAYRVGTEIRDGRPVKQLTLKEKN